MNRYIRNFICILGLVFFTYGCAVIQGWVRDGKDCFNDDKCRQESIAQANKVKGQITEVSGVVSPLPWIPTVAGSVGGGIALVVFLVINGKKKGKTGDKA